MWKRGVRGVERGVIGIKRGGRVLEKGWEGREREVKEG